MTIDESPPHDPVPRAPTPDDMRTVLGHFCSGVAVITGHDEWGPRGFTCQSVTSVSLDPPYVSLCPARSSSTWPMIRATGRMCINVLAADQKKLCEQFARSGDQKFVGVDWNPAANGAPRLHGALAVIEADLEFEYDAGDHTVAIARVTALNSFGGQPLLFYRGLYGGFVDRRLDPAASR